MYCRECRKEGKSVNMEVRIGEQTYVCPECQTIVKWSSINDEDFENGK